jgi:cell division protein FtsN
MSDNIIRSSYDKGYVSKSLQDKEEVKVENKPKTQKKSTTKKTTFKTTTSKAAPKKEEPKPQPTAVYSEGKLVHPALGRLDKGYNIVTPEQANEWMKISTKVKMATPEEVAIAYGV